MEQVKAEIAYIEEIAMRNGPNFLSMQDLQDVYNVCVKIRDIIGLRPRDAELIRIITTIIHLKNRVFDNIRALRILDEMKVEFDRILDAPGDVVEPMKALARRLNHAVLLQHPAFADLYSMIQLTLELACVM